MSDKLRSFDSWSKSIRNFESWLGGVIPGGSDLDFISERKGSFLVVEGKPYFKGVSVPWGQHLMLKALAELEPFTVVLVGEGNDGKLHLMDYFAATRKPVAYRRTSGAWFAASKFMPTDVEGLRSYVGSWWAEASEEQEAA